jgi:hypothetical protein
VPDTHAAEVPAPKPEQAARSEHQTAEAPVSQTPNGWFWGPVGRVDGSAGLEARGLLLLRASVGLEAGIRLGRFLSPSVRLLGSYGLSPRITPSAGAAHFEQIAARLEAAALRIELGSLALSQFISVEVGALTGRGESIDGIVARAEQTERWATLTQGLALDISLLNPVYLSVSVELREPIQRYQFVFRDVGGPIHVANVAALEFGAGVTVGSRFW